MANRGSTVIPWLRYRNADAVIDRLCTAFGIERHAIHAANVVHRAQLVHGDGNCDPRSQ